MTHLVRRTCTEIAGDSRPDRQASASRPLEEFRGTAAYVMPGTWIHTIDPRSRNRKTHAAMRCCRTCKPGGGYADDKQSDIRVSHGGFNVPVEINGSDMPVWASLLNVNVVWPYDQCMATITIKSTYSLDVETVRQLEELAKRWNTSKSGALRRAIQSAAKQVRSDRHEALDALDRLQSLLALDRESAQDWADEVRQERRAAAERSAPGPSE